MKVFLSSTYVDLIEHRKAAHDALEQLGLHVIWMESFGARPEESTKACLKEVEESDLFVGIYAHRYGYIPDEKGVSITEQEFDHAQKLRKPIFVFIVNEDHDWKIKHVEHDKKDKLNTFLSKVKKNPVDFFTIPDNLANNIASSVGHYLAKHKPNPNPASLPNSKTETPDFLLRITSGKELFSIIAGAHFSDFDYDEPGNKEELDFLRGFMQNLQDWADIGGEIEYGERVEIGYNLNQDIQALEEKGFVIFGKRENKKLKISCVEGYWEIAIIRILRNTNHTIVKIDLSQLSNESKDSED